MLPLLIDTDMAFDDWIAVLYLLSCPTVDIRALTIAATGEAHASFGVQNALRLITLTNRALIPVAAGRQRPLRGTHAFPLIARLAMDYHLGLALPRSSHQAAQQTAVELIIDQLRVATDPVTMIALGPLTNLAEVFTADSTLIKKVAMLYIMGGALQVPGNLAELNPRSKNPYAEWNIYIDPYATDLVFCSGVPITLAPLDVTNKYPLTPDFLQRCATTCTTPAARFTYQVLKRLQLLRRNGAIYFWDALAAVIAVQPGIAQFQECYLTVIQAEGHEWGRLVESTQGHPVRVCTQIDQTLFEQNFLTTLNHSRNASLEPN